MKKNTKTQHTQHIFVKKIAYLELWLKAVGVYMFLYLSPFLQICLVTVGKSPNYFECHLQLFVLLSDAILNDVT